MGLRLGVGVQGSNEIIYSSISRKKSMVFKFHDKAPSDPRLSSNIIKTESSVVTQTVRKSVLYRSTRDLTL